MLVSMENLIEAFKIVATVAILFVWFVRYDNIKKEFWEYGFPSWFRDIVGILKISSIAMLHSLNPKIVLIGASTIAALMLGAVLTHVKQKDTFRNTIASISMLIISILMISMI